MMRVTIIGSGNVAQHLIRAFLSTTDIVLQQVLVRQAKSLNDLVDSSKVITDYNDLKESDLYLIAVSDSAIAEVSALFPFTDRLVAHTSGTMSLETLSCKNRRAVFYPLQTFSKTKSVDFKKVPLCLEAENDEDLQTISSIGSLISDTVYFINSQQRKSLHVAAVFVNNFSNHLYSIGKEICDENNIPFDILKPLITETAAKIMHLDPKKAQTGPAIRGDQNTIDAHLKFLENSDYKNIYSLLTQSIQNDRQKL